MRALLAELNVTDEQLSAGTLLAAGTLRNVITGALDSPKARQRICDFLGVPIPDWGITPQPHELPPSAEELAALESVFERLESLGAELRAESDADARAAIRAKASALLDDGFAAAFRRQSRTAGTAWAFTVLPKAKEFLVELLALEGGDRPQPAVPHSTTRRSIGGRKLRDTK
ncbi:MAG: hypothetical protein ABMA13_12375 [Chthoniobacteraceae bacterium]